MHGRDTKAVNRHVYSVSSTIQVGCRSSFNAVVMTHGHRSWTTFRTNRLGVGHVTSVHGVIGPVKHYIGSTFKACRPSGKLFNGAVDPPMLI